MNLIKEKKILQDSLEESKNVYCKTINDLMNIVARKFPADENIIIIKEKFKAALACDKRTVVIKSGPFIWKYRVEISKRNEEFFLKQDFNNEIKQKSGFGTNELRTIIENLRNCWISLNIVEKNMLWNQLGKLLKYYAQYLGSEKKLRLINQKIRNA